MLKTLKKNIPIEELLRKQNNYAESPHNILMVLCHHKTYVPY